MSEENQNASPVKSTNSPNLYKTISSTLSKERKRSSLSFLFSSSPEIPTPKRKINNTHIPIDKEEKYECTYCIAKDKPCNGKATIPRSTACPRCNNLGSKAAECCINDSWPISFLEEKGHREHLVRNHRYNEALENSSILHRTV